MTDEVIQPDAAITHDGEVIQFPKPPQTYNVAWIMNEIEAHSPEEAAMRARAIQVDPNFEATIFIVFTPDGMQKAVDIKQLIPVVDGPNLPS